MINSKWIIKNHENLINYDLDQDILSILKNRGIDDKEKIDKFLNSDQTNLVNPFDLADMEKSHKRIISAIEKKEKIYIYGDYDVDGITSTAICYLGLKSLNADVHYYIPVRDEGYGLNLNAISDLKNNGANLIITVDCGISSIEEVNLANQLGMEVIITDHHEITTDLPLAYSVVNPKRMDNKTDFKLLAGCGVAYLLIKSLIDKNNQGLNDELLILAAIGTVADLVPLLEDNRILVKEGLKRINHTKNIGLKSLLPLLFENYQTHEYNTYDIGFKIAPVFNAAGRLEDAKLAVNLLTIDNELEGKQIASILKLQNDERKKVQNEILEKVIDKIEKEKLSENNTILVADKDFHHGVIGIVASKILDRFYKPTIIMEIKDDIAVGSARSIEGFNMVSALNSMKELFIKYGGHSAAAGFTLKTEDIPIFYKRLNSFADKKLKSEDYIKPIRIDKEIMFNKISYDFINKIDRLKPFGFGNPTPIFLIRDCQLANIRKIGKEKDHLMFDILNDGVENRNSVWFNSIDKFDILNHEDKFDIVLKLKLEPYMDKLYAKTYIEDIKPSENRFNELNYHKSLYHYSFPIKTYLYSRVNVELTDNLYLDFSDNNPTVKLGNMNIGFLENGLKDLLIKLKNYYNFQFKIDILKIESNYNQNNILISIKRNYEFKSLQIKANLIFKEIKEFLIGEFQYNSFQKKVLANIFKKNAPTLINCKRGRGIKTIYLTILIYNRLIGKKSLIIGNFHNESIFKNYCDISTNYIDGYDFYIFHNELPIDFIENSLIFSDTHKIYLDYEVIIDDLKIPNNIIITDDNDPALNYYKELPINQKLEYYNNIRIYDKIYSTKDISSIL